MSYRIISGVPLSSARVFPGPLSHCFKTPPITSERLLPFKVLRKIYCFTPSESLGFIEPTQ